MQTVTDKGDQVLLSLPMCKTTIGSEDIDFVEPRQTECPECGAMIDSKERE